MIITKELYKTSFRHQLSSCIVLGNTGFSYVPIPKNASTYLTHVFRDNLNFINYEYYRTLKNMKYLAVLRDPYDRWLTGIVEYIARYFPIDNETSLTPDLLNYFLKKIVLDPHTEPQVNFLHPAERKCTSCFGCACCKLHWFIVSTI